MFSLKHVKKRFKNENLKMLYIFCVNNQGGINQVPYEKNLNILGENYNQRDLSFQSRSTPAKAGDVKGEF
jgi:hypothetical protein